jgi:hypothetical protein
LKRQLQELSLQKLLGIDNRVEIGNNVLARFLNVVSICNTHKEIVDVIKNEALLNNKQKLALLRFFRDNELYTQSLFNQRNLMSYVKQCLKYLPLTKQQRLEVCYEFDKINKNRFKNNG